jgi:hypothetical protein
MDLELLLQLLLDILNTGQNRLGDFSSVGDVAFFSFGLLVNEALLKCWSVHQLESLSIVNVQYLI